LLRSIWHEGVSHPGITRFPYYNLEVVNEQLENILKNAPPDISQEILRINEIARIDGIKASLRGLIIISLLGIFATFYLPPEILVSPQQKDKKQ
jgi:hypothetical protein